MDELRYARIIRAVLERPWAILPTTLSMIVEVLHLHATGLRLTPDEAQARIDAAGRDLGPRQGGGRENRQPGSVAVIPVYGILAQRAGSMSSSEGGTSTEAIRGMFDQAIGDDTIDGIVLDFDSPGGTVDGIAELASHISASRGVKPIAAVANGTMASAAFWIGSAADTVSVTPSGIVGSIGVLAAHEDWSRHFDTEGITTTLISAGKYKAERSKFAPLTDEAREAIQADVDAYYGMFVDAVAQNRGVTARDVRAGYGEGRVVMARPALEAGMVDRIETLDQAIIRVAEQGARHSVKAHGNRQAALAGWGTLTAAAWSQGIADGVPTYADGSTPLLPLASVDETAQDATPAAALGSGLPFSDRLALVSASAAALAEHAQAHAAMRAAEGRGLSGTTRDQVAATAVSLRGIAEALDQVVAQAVEADAPESSPAPRRNVLLDIHEAALRGGYPLP